MATMNCKLPIFNEMHACGAFSLRDEGCTQSLHRILKVKSTEVMACKSMATTDHIASKTNLGDHHVNGIKILAVFLKHAHESADAELQAVLQNYPWQGMLPINLVTRFLNLAGGESQPIC